MTSGCKGQRVSGDTAGSRFLTSDFANEKGVGGANVERLLSVESSHGRGSTFCAKMSLGDLVLHVRNCRSMMYFHEYFIFLTEA